jgi:UDP-3-O-[3-hydroxymyristoyl] glucosamine N-acyltransferase
MTLIEVSGVAPLDIIRDGGFESLGLLFYSSPRMLVCLHDPKYLKRELLPNSAVSCVVTHQDLAASIPAHLGLAVATDPMTAFYTVHEHLFQNTDFYWRDFASEIAPDARIHPSAQVAPRNVRIGPRTCVEEGATIRERSLIGADCVLRAGVVIGAEGCEPKRIGGRMRNVPHAGGVRIGDRVEIQSNSCVACCVFGTFTEIGDETMISTLVNISHNVSIGKRCRISSSAVVLGSSRIGDEVWIGPNSTISNRVQIGDGAFVSLGSVVVSNVSPGARVSGNFAVDHQRFLSAFRKMLK